jgi:hypothetical protein
VPQYLADLVEGRTLSQEFAGQAVTELMCGVSRSINAGAEQTMSND